LRKTNEWRGSKNQNDEHQGQPQRPPIPARPSIPPIPSTSGTARRTDPLAQARLEWNEGIREEYKAKFEKWSKLKAEAEKRGITIGKNSRYA
jgi:hypothetical protein